MISFRPVGTGVEIGLRRRATFLETPGLFFRSHQTEDQADFVAMHAGPEIRRCVGGKPWSSAKAVDRFRHQYLDKPSKTYDLWVTILQTESRYTGPLWPSGQAE